MLQSLVEESGRFLGTIWYLSAMLIVLPVLCFLLLKYREAFAYIFSWLFVFIYIAKAGISSLSWGLIALKRAFCFISLGIASYYLGKCIASLCSNRVKRLVMTIVELLVHCYIIFAVTYDFAIQRIYVLLAFFIGITIMLSGCSYSSQVKGKLLRYLGELSVSIFVSQLFIGDFIKYLCLFLSNSFSVEIGGSVRIVAYFGFTILFSAVLKFCVDFYTKKQRERLHPAV